MLALLVSSCTAFHSPISAATVITSVVYVADNGQVIRALYRDDDTVTLNLPDGKTEILELAISASGARYVSGEKEWWEHQGQATYRVDDELIFSGKLQHLPTPTDE